jgi:hypothetical protein
MDSDQQREDGAGTVDSTIRAAPTIMNYGNDDAQGAFRRRINWPGGFLCLIVGGDRARDGRFPETTSARRWAHEFRECESRALVEWIKEGQAVEASSVRDGAPPTCIVAVVDPIARLSSEEEFGDRSALVREGVILVERPDAGTAATADDELIRQFVSGALTAVQQQLSAQPAPPVAPGGSPFNWTVTLPPSDDETEMYGREMAHAPFPPNDKLEEMFKESYLPDDDSRRDALDN